MASSSCFHFCGVLFDLNSKAGVAKVSYLTYGVYFPGILRTDTVYNIQYLGPFVQFIPREISQATSSLVFSTRDSKLETGSKFLSLKDRGTVSLLLSCTVLG